MRRFWNKANRGLLLGAVLLIALIVFIIVKEVQFRTELPEIRGTVKESLQAMLEVNIAPEGAQLGKAWSAEQKEIQRRRLENVLVTYWDADGTNDYYYTASEVRASYGEYLGKDCCVLFEEISLVLSDDDIRIVQNGTDYVTVSVEIDTMSATWIGDGEMLFFGESVYFEEMEGVTPFTYRGNYEGWFEMELHRVDGAWRVVATSGYFSLAHKALVTGGVS